MALKRYTKMEYGSPDEMVFGEAKYPVSYGLGQTVGAGMVIPEINFAPRPGAEKNPETLRREYVDYITKDILDRAITLGFPAVQLENEHVFQMVNEPEKFEKPVVAGQKELMQKYHDEYGIALSIRHTIADPRLAEEGLRPGMDQKHSYPEKMFEAFEVAAANGADLLSIETMGGKEVADYAILRQDIRGWLFGIGYLGSLD
ncbi:MAG TPA: methyltransferase MtaB domain-containing protein, partial [Methanomassiliicoccaceae archaeon]|nr:methyltransferase MtaB domain-containing protein [Methanomassiliicoccaceae archaeon]HOK27509.1 methyltransferase MtaB domain-containing protein [Methanomassiliicoccaceae archaeon]HOQ26692.1 methyltransferase MtaB domain-containing protein [Methanomassiliicoccaceae archaeon]HQD88588.1 methyltransferase MtaB domain-containing protein [Methanomassiliicoccaceae archaeon]